MMVTDKQAEEIAAKAVAIAFERMGIHGPPDEMQRDMAYLRDSRKRHAGIVNRVTQWFITGIILGGSALAWREALAQMFKGWGNQ